MKNMMKNKLIRTLTLAAPLALLAVNGLANSVPGGHDRLEKEVRHELLMLPYYGVFDNLTYSIKDNSVELSGHVTRPALKSQAGNVVKSIEGVTEVKNNIEVLPLSGFDDRIRLSAFRAIYRDAALSTRYGYRAQPPIHIIVSNGHIKLEGFVANEFDRNLVNIRVSGVPGVFSVTNNLQIDTAIQS